VELFAQLCTVSKADLINTDRLTKIFHYYFHHHHHHHQYHHFTDSKIF